MLEVKAFLGEEHAGRIHLAAQPGYRSQLNADEQAWNELKSHPLANVCGKTLAKFKKKGATAAEKLRFSLELI